MQLVTVQLLEGETALISLLEAPPIKLRITLIGDGYRLMPSTLLVFNRAQLATESMYS